MDPISQGVVGALCARPLVPKRQWPYFAVIAWLSGMAPDLDVFIRSAEQPLLSLIYHRHFTHALLFTPFGGLLCTGLFYGVFLRKRGFRWKHVYIACTVGWASHGPLDACTSYGTQLFWPFSNMRVSWDLISIIDPLFTVPLLILLVLSMRARWQRCANIAIVYMCLYLGLAFVQHERALQTAHALAAARGHEVTQLSVRPSLGNIVLWRSMYRSEDTWYIDAIRALDAPQVIEGDSTPVFDSQAALATLPPESPLAHDVQTFAWFTNHHLTFAPSDPQLAIDVRYAMLPNSTRGIWGIRIDPERANRHVAMQSLRSTSPDTWDRFTAMLLGLSP